MLVVDDRGDWKRMVEHGRTGWLWRHPRDFIYFASKMAYEPNQRADMAEAARLRGHELGGLEASAEEGGTLFLPAVRLVFIGFRAFLVSWGLAG